ncbi:hypothetical protein [Pseudomonas sp.]|uniref:hypothetical protein n=1 Tax=Pseudomonas sp. TaxID=306 RepID=UPI002734662D|nr:hypothetical protein [Pseudomonas sp.]MDP3816682.1 hypothetical protein [Pseudomonas sp.]
MTDRKEGQDLGATSIEAQYQSVPEDYNPADISLEVQPDWLPESVPDELYQQDNAETLRREAEFQGLDRPFVFKPKDEEELIALEDAELHTVAAPALAVDEVDSELPGRLGDLQCWLLKRMKRPSPLGAAAVVLTVAGHLYGRHFLGPTGLGQNLLTVICAQTGRGKDCLVKAPPILISALGERMAETISGQFASRPALHEHLMEQPATLAAIDEVGHLLRGMGDHRQGHMHDLGGFWLELFSAPDNPSLRPRRRRKEGRSTDLRPIKWPHFSSVGATTPAMLGEALSAQMTAAGQLNRMLLATLDDWNGHRQDPDFGAGVPEWWKPWALEQMKRGSQGDQPPSRMGWHGEAREVWRRRADALEDALEHEPETTRELRNRDAEHALKIAQILALSDGQDEVEARDIHWAFAYVERLQWGVLQLCRAEGILAGGTLDAVAESVVQVLHKRGYAMTEAELGKFCRPFGRTKGGDRQHVLRLLQESHGVRKIHGERGAVRYCPA